MTANDMLIEAFASSEAALLERVASLEADVEVYRQLTQTALTVVHDVTVERDQLRAQHHRLLDQYRHLREQTLRRVAA